VIYKAFIANFSLFVVASINIGGFDSLSLYICNANILLKGVLRLDKYVYIGQVYNFPLKDDKSAVSKSGCVLPQKINYNR
jgi:hypothetical protein